MQSSKGRKFLTHLGSYVIVIGALMLINILTGDEPWFLYPAAGWGAGLILHLFSLISMNQLSRRWRSFIKHLGSYVVIIAMLAVINAASGGDIWFIWPALGWGVGLAFHLLSAVLGTDRSEESAAETEVEEETGRKERRRHRGRHERRVEVPQAAAPSPPPTTVVDQALLAYVQKAQAYQDQIEQVLKGSAADATRSRPEELRAQVAEWVKAIEDLARRVDNFQKNVLIRQDLETVPRAIADLEGRLANESDEAIRAQLERTLTSRKNQLASLERLRQTMHRAEIQVESTLSALGTIYSQLLTGQSTDHVADYSRLSAEAEEEVRTLQDQLEALEEVKLGRA